MKGFPVMNLVQRAATFNSESRAVYIPNPEQPLTSQTRAVVLVEASSLDTLLYSRLFIISEPHWRHSIPDLEWLGVYGAGPQRGQQENMVINEARGLRGEIAIDGLGDDGTVTVTFGDQSRQLGPGEEWLLDGPYPFNRLVVVNHGIWDARQVTYALQP